MANSKDLLLLAQAKNYEKLRELITTRQNTVHQIALIYALDGNHDKVEEYRTKHQASVHQIVQGYALAGNHDKVEEYRTRHQASVHMIARAYAGAGNHDKVEEYRTRHQASVHMIARDYAGVGNHDKVEEYRTRHHASIHAIVKGYAQGGNHDKVEEYRTRHQASVHNIATGYVQGGNHDKVEEYRTRHHASIHVIVKGYAQGGNHDKVEEYRTKHQASVHEIARGYALAGNHDKVEEYRTKHQASVHEIAQGYALAGNHDKVEEYRTRHQASVHGIAAGYAQGGNHDKVEEYRTRHQASVHVIAKAYALAGNHAKVEEYRTRHQASIYAIVNGYAGADNHAKVEEYRTRHQASVDEIAKGYAGADNHAKVEEYRAKHQASVHKIARGYALAGNHDKVEEYRTRHQASVHEIARGYAVTGYHDKVEEYRTRYQASVHTIAKGYALAGSHDKVEEYRSRHQASVHEIVQGYAQGGGNHAKVEEYRSRHQASVHTIAKGYALAGNHDKVEEYRTKHYALLYTIIQAYAKAGYHDKVEEYRTKDRSSELPIVEAYAKAGYHDKVEEYRTRDQTLVYGIARGYALAGNHAKVEEYRTKHQASVHKIAQGYALAGYYDKVEEYRTKHQASVDEIARSYAQAGYHDKVEEYRIVHDASVHAIFQGYSLGHYYAKKEEYRTMHQASVHTIAKGYALAGNHDKVEEYRTKHQASVHEIVQGYAQGGNHAKVEEYRSLHQASVHTIAKGYALAGNHDKVEEYRTKHQASVHEIVQGYAQGDNHAKVEEYRIRHQASVNMVAKAYAEAGNHDKVEEYRTRHQASVDAIARGYALAGNHAKVEEYRIRHQASVHEIAAGYAQGGNHAKVEEYRIRHQASVRGIILGYARAGNHAKEKEYNELSDVLAPPSIQGGIHTKYTTGSPHPRLPKSQKAVNDTSSMHHKLPLTPVCNMSLASGSFYTHSITTPAFGAKLITQKKDMEFASPALFICAGRTVNALVPLTQKIRCTLICTEEESIQLLPYLSSQLDLLVISKIESKYYGVYSEAGSITARRLAAFLFAYYAHCPQFALLDDNIASLSFSPEIIPSDSWDSVMDFLGLQTAEQASLSVGTLGGHKKRPGELGSKFFMVNMQLIRQMLQAEEDLFCLFPEAAQAKKWGEDYYFQIVLHYLFAEQNIAGYGILPLEKIGLFRSKQQKNLFAATGKKAELFELPCPIQAVPSPFHGIIKAAIKELNQIIEKNYRHHEDYEGSMQQVDLLSLHAKANGQRLDLVASRPSLVQSAAEFKTCFAQFIHGYDFASTPLRGYQVEAIQAAASYSGPSRLVMATGSGKSLIQSTLALMAYHTAAANQSVFIVTPHIELVIQFYQDLLRYNNALQRENNPLSIPQQQIITVSSHTQSISAIALLKNQRIHQQSTIIICCEDSFKKILESQSMIHRAALILLDEYHEYTATVKNLIAELPSDAPMVIASSATPPNQDLIKNTLYSFSLQQALNSPFHAPLIVDTINIPYSLANLNLILKWLPKILRNQYHPGFQEGVTLAETKGLIYLKSIELCNKAQKILREAGLNAYAIHSDNALSLEEVKQFVQSNQPGILLAVRKLRFGFDCPDLAWEFILRPPSQQTARQDIEQMLGRVIRHYQDKLGYVVTFEDIYKQHIHPLIQNQEKLPALSTDYLANADAKEYHLQDDSCVVVDYDLAEAQKYSARFFQTRPPRTRNDNQCTGVALDVVDENQPEIQTVQIGSFTLPIVELTPKSPAFFSTQAQSNDSMMRLLAELYQSGHAEIEGTSLIFSIDETIREAMYQALHETKILDAFDFEIIPQKETLILNLKHFSPDAESHFSLFGAALIHDYLRHDNEPRASQPKRAASSLDSKKKAKMEEDESISVAFRTHLNLRVPDKENEMTEAFTRPDDRPSLTRCS
ncbi:DEAD/DEAH box helicase [Legionella donaldsonii]|uniref:DEAD/DEAH box helicase n=1 Tax=Legionella donaldsonii TaxID=45060 RepID=UPI00399CFA18